MNLFLGAAPTAQVAHGALGCMVSIDDRADDPRPRSARAEDARDHARLPLADDDDRRAANASG